MILSSYVSIEQQFTINLFFSTHLIITSYMICTKVAMTTTQVVVLGHPEGNAQGILLTCWQAVKGAVAYAAVSIVFDHLFSLILCNGLV